MAMLEISMEKRKKTKYNKEDRFRFADAEQAKKKGNPCYEKSISSYGGPTDRLWSLF